MQKYNLNVFLLKNSINNYNEAIRDDIENLEEYRIREFFEIDGMLYVGENEQNKPNWNKLLSEGLTNYDIQSTMSTRAVLFIENNNRIFAFTFGHGRHLLEKDSFVRGFGLRVLLNNALDGSLKSVNTTIFDETPISSTLQTSKSVLLSEFNITDIRTMFTSVTAESVDKYKYGSIIRGKDSFAFSHKLNFSDIENICTNLLEDYTNEDYRETFPELDRMEEVNDPTKLTVLNEILIQRLINNEIESFYIPEIINWEYINGFQFTKKGFVDLDLSIKRFKEEKRNFEDSLTVKYLKNHKIYCVSSDENQNVDWSVYDCLQTEVQEGDDIFIFSIGKWFKVENDFIAEIDEFIENVNDCELEFPILNGEHEQEANELIEKEMSNILNLDRNTAVIAGSQYEICDLLSKCQRLIHVKWWDSSATLSHLFSQGRVSGDILQNSYAQRREFHNKLDDRNPDFSSVINPEQYNSHEYTIVYAIIYPNNQTIVERLPFFSKANLKHNVSLLKNMGYNVELAHIETSQKRVKKDS